MKVKIFILYIFLLIFLENAFIKTNKLTRHRKRHRHRHIHHKHHKSHKYHSHSHKKHSKVSRKSHARSNPTFLEKNNPLIPNILPINPSIDINQINPNQQSLSGVNGINNLSNENINQMILAKLTNNQRKNHSSIIFARSVKTMFEGLYHGYNQLLRKFHVHAKVVFDPVRKIWFKVANKLPDITCTNYHAVLLDPEHIKSLYRTVHQIDKKNYKTYPKKILKNLENLVLEVGNNCENLLNVVEFTRKQFRELTFLKKKNYHNPWLLLQILSARNNFIHSWGKFRKMGMFLGHIFAWYKIYKPPKEVVSQNNSKLLQAALALLKKDVPKK